MTGQFHMRSDADTGDVEQSEVVASSANERKLERHEKQLELDTAIEDKAKLEAWTQPGPERRSAAQQATLRT
jgi:hypothetical protein